MDVVAFILIVLALVIYAVALLWTIVILPTVVEKGKLMEKIVHGLRTSFLYTSATRILIVT